MKLCFPVACNAGLESTIFNHFGSAPMFLIVDSETREVTSTVSNNGDLQHGSCSPVGLLGQAAVDAVVVSGIGAGALTKLRRAGYEVYLTQGTTIAANLEKHASMTPVADQVCSGHHHGAEHGHSHGCHH